MRQAGFLAAAGIYALEHNVKRLGEDHRKAREIGKILSTLPYIEDVIPVETNILIFKTSIDEKDFLFKLKEKGILATAFGPKTIRFVTHLDFTEDMLSRTIDILKSI
jgi:threonine aldolase